MNKTPTLRVKMRTCIAGENEPDLPGEFIFKQDEIIDLPEPLARKWIAGGVAMAALHMKTEAEVKLFRLGIAP